MDRGTYLFRTGVLKLSRLIGTNHRSRIKPLRIIHQANPFWQLFMLLCCIGCGAAHAAPASTKVSPVTKAITSPTPSPSPPATPPPLSLAEIAPRSETDLATLQGFEPDDRPDKDTSDVRESLPDLSDRVSQLLVQGTKATVGAGGALDIIRDLQSGWRKLQATLIQRGDILGQRGRTLESEEVEVDKLQAIWNSTDKAARADQEANAPPETLDLVRNVLYATRDAKQRIKVRQTSVLELQTRVGELNTKVGAGLAAAEQANDDAVKTLFDRDNPPIWDTQAEPAPDLLGRWRASYVEQLDELHNFVRSNVGLFAIHAGIFLALLIVLLWLRRGLHTWTEEEPHLKRAAPIFEVPIATALALSFLIKGTMYSGAPTLFRTLSGATALVPTVIMLRRLLDRRLYFILYALILFFCVDQVRVATESLPALNRWIFLGEMAGATVVFLLLTRAQRLLDRSARAFLGRWLPWLNILAVTVFSAAFVAALIGYVRLGTLLGAGALGSSYVAVFLYALLRVVDGLILISLRLPPASSSRIAQSHREAVRRNVYRFFRAIAVLFWAFVTLNRLQLWSPVSYHTANVLAARIPLGSLSLTIGSLLSFVIAIWVSIVVSRTLRFFLDEEVYERVHLSPGLPYAISTMLNYLVLLIGFLIALGMLGVDLTKITIVAGAFSVGLGFGLQNIINNFVSGIILLFERPVKVGDIIQIGDAIGEVRRIGIRASIVRTREGSDVILPNGNLISNQVTNWTYADRCRAVEIPFNIAVGPEPNHVLNLLREAAIIGSATDRPVPEAYITAIGASGLTVIVRAWTTRYEDWIQVRSDLSVALVAALTREGIRLV